MKHCAVERSFGRSFLMPFLTRFAGRRMVSVLRAADIFCRAGKYPGAELPQSKKRTVLPSFLMPAIRENKIKTVNRNG